MIRIATVADARFQRRAANLSRSLENSPNDYRLTIYCDDARRFDSLSSPRCDIVELAQLRLLGAKRAKLTAIATAVRGGSFIYLDADAIVLENLDGMCGGTEIRGCADDLQHCPFIPDKMHPWPDDPTLVNRRYINSGAFFAPAERYAFFEHLRVASLDDELWRKYTLDKYLYDNHFLCAFLNLGDEPVAFLDPEVYGWRGFLEGGRINVRRDGSHLVNGRTGSPLAVVLFAGVQQTPELLRSLPFDIRTLIFERITRSDVSLDEALAQVYAALGRCLPAAPADPFVNDILAFLLADVPDLAQANSGAVDLRGRSSYFSNPDAMKAIAFSSPPPQCGWNGLRCGGAYLDADEYRTLRMIISKLNIRTILETGAGETSILFRSLGVKTCSLEYQWGPWADRAVSHGCTCLLVPFDHEHRRFSEPELRERLAEQQLSNVDLLFIDSPIGTRNRQNLLSQILTYVKTRFVVYHDSLRDSANIFEDQIRHGLRMIYFLNSPRGMTLFAVPPCEESVPLADSFDAATVVPEPRARIAMVDCCTVCRPGEQFRVRIALTNTTAATFSSRYSQPVHMAYHWLTPAGQMVVFDGVRTRLPYDLEPGDSAEFLLDVAAPGQEGEYVLQATVVQEGVTWFETIEPKAAAASVYVKAST